MSLPGKIPAPAARLLICARCGAEFACTLSSDCWCADESARLPVPDDGGDCLCGNCLSKAAKPAQHH
jgi:hypothetical protein